jgi:hypothetical protein
LIAIVFASFSNFARTLYMVGTKPRELGNWGAIRFNTVPRVPRFSREKRRKTADDLTEPQRSAGDIEQCFRPIVGHAPRKFPPGDRIHPRATSHIYAHHASLLYTIFLEIAIVFEKFSAYGDYEIQRFLRLVFVSIAQYP